MALATAAGTEAAASAGDAAAVGHLPNGLVVTTIVDRRLPLVAIDISYKVGDANDPPDLPGLAQRVGGLLENAPTKHLRAGEVGAVFFNKRFIEPGTVNTTGDYHHYSALRSYERSDETALCPQRNAKRSVETAHCPKHIA